MLTCLPKSPCSWSFWVRNDDDEVAAEVHFNVLTEQGQIIVGPNGYSVVKHGWLSGHWSLDHDGQAIVNATKNNPFARSFELSNDSAQWTLRAQSLFTRCFDLSEAGSPRGTIYPKHPFTRRSVIDCDSAVPTLIQLFAFWLVVLTWRRAANNNS